MLKNIAFIACFVWHFSCFAQQAPIDVLHYKFNIRLHDSSDVINGIADIRFKILQPVDTIVLDLETADTSMHGMVVQEVVESGKKLAAFQHSGNKLVIPFPSQLQPKEEKTVQVRYTGRPTDGLIIAKNKYGARTIFADNWPNRAHCWLPCIDNPADKASVEFLVTAPDHYAVISNGVRVYDSLLPQQQRHTHYKEAEPLPTKVMVIGLANFAIQQSGYVHNIPVSSWLYPPDSARGFYDYALAPSILSWFIDKVGPYSYQKLANVQSTTRFGGMENASAIFYGENTVTGTRSNEKLIAHEIAHQWFGNAVTEVSFDHLWLSEGFATYFTDLYFEARYGVDSFRHRLKDEREQVIAFSKKTTAPVVHASNNYMSMLNAFSYQKGAWVLHMLRRKTGDSIFFKTIRAYYNSYKGKNANTNDLRRMFEETSGLELQPFFQQWLYKKDHPVLTINWHYNQIRKKIVINIEQRQVAAYPFPLVLQVMVNGKSVRKTIAISAKNTTVGIAATTKPTNVMADPDVDLLFEATVQEVNQ